MVTKAKPVSFTPKQITEQIASELHTQRYSLRTLKRWIEHLKEQETGVPDGLRNLVEQKEMEIQWLMRFQDAYTTLQVKRGRL